MSHQINLLCLTLLTYFFLPVLSAGAKNRLLGNSNDGWNLGQYPPPGQYPPSGQYPPPGQYLPPRQYPPPGQYPPSGQYPIPAPPTQGAVPPNPCPTTFRYLRGENGEVQGQIRVPFDYHSNSLELGVNISMKEYYDKKSKPKITILTPPQNVFEKSTTHLLYQLKFPTQISIPRIVEINLNGKVYCRGPGEEMKWGGPPILYMYVTNEIPLAAGRNQEEMLDDDDDDDIAGIARQSNFASIENVASIESVDGQYGLL